MKEQLLELKRLILDERFTNLKSFVNKEINLMSILGVAHKELQHSNFLSWLFDPKETHGKEDYFIKEFIKLYFRENQYDDLGGLTGLSVFDFVRLNLDDLDIKREHKNIDLLLTSLSNKLIIVIENKIFARERKGQLKKYRTHIENNYQDYKYRIYIYLSLFEQEISQSEQEYYVCITYEHIIKLLESSLESDLSENTRFVISQYIQTLKVIMNDNSEIEKLAKELYDEYKPSFDLVYKYISPSTVSGRLIGRVPNNIEQYIKNDVRIIPALTDKRFKRFTPLGLIDMKPALVKKGIIPESYDFYKECLFWFEFVVTSDKIDFVFLIGKYANKESRKILYNQFFEEKDSFNAIRDRLSPVWNRCATHRLLTKANYSRYLENEDIDLEGIIKKEYEHVIDTMIPKIVASIEKLVKEETN